MVVVVTVVSKGCVMEELDLLVVMIVMVVMRRKNVRNCKVRDATCSGGGVIKSGAGINGGNAR